MFVPIILVFALALMVAWLVLPERPQDSFYRSMAVLVAASPCGLAIATSSAVLSSVAIAARRGVLVKIGAALEAMAKATTFAFDKTGTLTEGKLGLTDVIPLPGVTEAELLKTTGSIEIISDPPIAQGVVEGINHRLPDFVAYPTSDVKSVTGLGIEAQMNGHFVQVGNAALFQDSKSNVGWPLVEEKLNELLASGLTTVIVRETINFLGLWG